MEAPIPVATPKPSLSDEIKEENFYLKFKGKTYNCSLKLINDTKINFVLTTLSKNSSEIYENEYDLFDLQEINRNFKIYENIRELLIDLVSYIRQDRIKISYSDEKVIIIEINLQSRKDNIVNLKLNNKNVETKNTELLDKPSGEMNDLKLKISELEMENKKIKKEFFQELKIKDKKILELEKRLEFLEKSQGINNNSIINSSPESNNNNSIDLRRFNVFCKNSRKLNLKLMKKYNPKYLNNEMKNISTDRAINDLRIFPKSGNFMETSGPSIYDCNGNLIKTFSDLGCCSHLCIIKEDLIALSNYNSIIILKIIDNNNYEVKTFNECHKGEIKKIIKGFHENEIISSDSSGNIQFSTITLKDNTINLNFRNIIESNREENTYILLINNILVIGNDKLYFYNLDINYVTTFENLPSYEIQPLCWNSMVIIDKTKCIIGVGTLKITYILQISNLNSIKKLKEIKISSDLSSHEALCLYQEEFLLIGTRSGNIYLFDISNNYELLKTINYAHKIINDFAINGITELSDGTFASYGEDKVIKIW